MEDGTGEQERGDVGAISSAATRIPGDVAPDNPLSRDLSRDLSKDLSKEAFSKASLSISSRAYGTADKEHAAWATALPQWRRQRSSLRRHCTPFSCISWFLR